MLPQVGYVRSWSAYQTFRKAHPDAADPAQELEAQLLLALGPGAGRDTEVRVLTPIVLLLARQPRRSVQTAGA